MKKLAILWKLLFVFSVVQAQTSVERKQYDRAAHEIYKDVENHIQIFLSEELVLTNDQSDTVITYRNGHPVMKINNKQKTITIKTSEKGKIENWSGDTAFVKFITKKKGQVVIPFTHSNGSGRNQAMTIKTVPDTVYQLQTPVNYKDFPMGHKVSVGVVVPNTYTLTVNEVKYKVSGRAAHIEYEPVLEEKNKAEKKKSKALIVK